MAVPGKPAQAFVPIREIRDGVIVLESGELRRVLITSTLNFGLKSADEQIAIISSFQGFLNGLDFSVQIFIQSKRLDIRPYLHLLEEREKVQLNDAMRIQVHEYINFIREFTGRTNIMSKNFFVVVPMPAMIPRGKPGATDMEKREEQRQFEQSRMQLEQRVQVVQSGLGGCDVKTTPLGTEELTELFYKKFNPGELETSVQG